MCGAAGIKDLVGQMLDICIVNTPKHEKVKSSGHTSRHESPEPALED